MTPQILLLLCLLAVALALFWWERISSEVLALGLLLSLAFTGLLPTDQAFAGFGSDTVIMILGRPEGYVSGVSLGSHAAIRLSGSSAFERLL